MPSARKKARLKRAQARQAKALYLQRNRIKRFRTLRAEIRKRRSNIGRRRKLIGRLKAELISGPVTIKGNRAYGGSPRQRLEAVAKAAALAHLQGRRKSFYSQSGRWSTRYAITGEPPGYRSDCSQFWISVYWSAGLEDPTGANYTGGWTGTIGNHGHQISANDRAPGDAGLYGPFPHYHVELCVGGGGFIGHGSPPVDAVTPGFPNVFRTFL